MAVERLVFFYDWPRLDVFFPLTHLPHPLFRLGCQTPNIISEVLISLQYAIPIERSMLILLLLTINRFVAHNCCDLEVFCIRHLNVLLFQVPALVKVSLHNEGIAGNWMETWRYAGSLDLELWGRNGISLESWVWDIYLFVYMTMCMLWSSLTSSFSWGPGWIKCFFLVGKWGTECTLKPVVYISPASPICIIWALWVQKAVFSLPLHMTSSWLRFPYTLVNWTVEMAIWRLGSCWLSITIIETRQHTKNWNAVRNWFSNVFLFMLCFYKAI